MADVICSIVVSNQHYWAGHPESPDRFTKILPWLNTPPYSGVKFVHAAPASHEEILRVHSPEMLLSLKIACEMGLQKLDPSPTFVNENSCTAMRDAAGATLKLSRMILHEEAKCGFALVRPPGHHADAGKPGGFCLLNNLAIAAADALEAGLERIAIIDFDAHHGDGTQAIFWDDARVGVFSLHEEDIYPGSGLLSEQLKGRIINLPLPHQSGDEVLEPIFFHILDPWIKRFKPQMIFVSAGFDGHFADPLTGLGFSTSGFHTIAQHLKTLADTFSQGRLLFVLEGGYDPLVLKECVQAVLCTCCGFNHYPDSYGINPYQGDPIDDRILYLLAFHQLEH